MKTNGLRFSALLLALAMFSPLALAQLPPSAEVFPQPAVAGEPLTVLVHSGMFTCQSVMGSVDVTHVGNQVIFDFEVIPDTGPGICTIPAPLSFQQSIGQLPAGQYELVLNRTYDGIVSDPVIIPFGVLPGDMPAALPIPVGQWILPALVLLLLLVGWRRLRTD